MSKRKSVERSYQERNLDAKVSYRHFVPQAEPEQVATSFEARLGALGSFAFDIVGDMWNRPALARRDRSMMIISTLASQSREEELVVHTQIGLRHGLTRLEIEEILPHIAAYAGFPAAMAAARQIDEGLRQFEGIERLSRRQGAEHQSDAQRDTHAAETLAKLDGREVGAPSADLQVLTDKYGYLGEWSYRWVLGEIWHRSELNMRDRCLVTLAIVIAQGGDSLLSTTIQQALHGGLTSNEIEEMAAHIGLYAGLPKAMAAMEVIKGLAADQAEEATQ